MVPDRTLCEGVQGELVRDGGVRTAYAAVAAVPAFVRIDNVRPFFRHRQDEAGAIFHALSALVAVAAVKAAFRFYHG